MLPGAICDAIEIERLNLVDPERRERRQGGKGRIGAARAEGNARPIALAPVVLPRINQLQGCATAVRARRPGRDILVLHLCYRVSVRVEQG